MVVGASGLVLVYTAPEYSSSGIDGAFHPISHAPSVWVHFELSSSRWVLSTALKALYQIKFLFQRLFFRVVCACPEFLVRGQLVVGLTSKLIEPPSLNGLVHGDIASDDR
jgi:hypothetical protein